MRTWQPHSPCKDARAILDSDRLSAYAVVVIANLPKSKGSDEAVKITKDRHTTKILRHASLAFLKVAVVVGILNCSFAMHSKGQSTRLLEVIR